MSGRDRGVWKSAFAYVQEHVNGSREEVVNGLMQTMDLKFRNAQAYYFRAKKIIETGEDYTRKSSERKAKKQEAEKLAKENENKEKELSDKEKALRDKEIELKEREKELEERLKKREMELEERELHPSNSEKTANEVQQEFVMEVKNPEEVKNESLDAAAIIEKIETEQRDILPVGIVSRKVWDFTRKKEISKAILRYIEAGLGVPPEWIQELQDLNIELEKKEDEI